MELIFSVQTEFCNGQPHLLVKVERKEGSARIVYLSDLQLWGKDKELVRLLCQERCREAGIPVTSSQLQTLSCQKIFVRPSFSFLVIQRLVALKEFSWKGRSLFFNPLSKTGVKLEVESLSPSSLQVNGFVILDGESFAFTEVEVLFFSEPIWGIVRQRLFLLPKEIRPSFLAGIYPSGKKFEGSQREEFLEEYREDPPHGFPPITWKGDYAPRLLEPYPVLVLRDYHGSFADLFMDYEGHLVDFWDRKEFLGRNQASEKGWERDLLETDFQRRACGDSQYYVPLDKVSKSLSFLLDIGWKIVDKKGKELVRLEAESPLWEERKEGIFLRRDFRYKEHVAHLQDVVGAFNRRERFLDLSPSHVAFLEEGIYETVYDFADADFVAGGCLVPRCHIGALDRGDSREEGPSLLSRLQGVKQNEEEMTSFSYPLYPYQEEGRRFLLRLQRNGFSGLLADEMGLGKTVQTLAFISSVEWDAPLLLVVPTSLVFNWKREWQTYLPSLPLYIHEGSAREGREVLQQQKAILTSYAYLRRDHALLSQIPFSLIVLDEAQLIKNPDSQLARAAFGLQGKMKLALSGTPIENRADDLWSLFHFLEPELLGEKREFLASLVASQSDERHAKKIKRRIKPFILRRLKEEVAKDLPEKIEQTIYVEMEPEQRAFYEGWLQKAKLGLLQKESGGKASRIEVLEVILRLRQICCHPLLVGGEPSLSSAKLQRVVEDLEEVVEQKRKVLVYSQFTEFLKILSKEAVERGWRFAYLDGETKDREQVVAAFQDDPSLSLFLISLKAGGVGLNLTAADYVFLLDPWWNEAVERQAIDRAHRFGRKEQVIARRYLVASTLEEKMRTLKEHKKNLAVGFLDAEESALSFDDLLSLLES